MEEIKFDLQLFAEGDGEVDVDANTEQADGVDSVQIDTPKGDDRGANDTPSDGSIGIVVDPRTGKRTVEMITQNNNAGSQEPEQEPAPAQESTSSSVSGNVQIQPYTPQELIAAAQMGVVDENRISDELQQPYDNYKQQILLQHQTQQTQSPPPAQQNQDSQKNPDPKEFYTLLADTALKNTLNELGMSQEDYEALSYNDDPNAKKIFEVAYQSNVQRLVGQMQAAGYQEQARQAEKKAVLGEIAAFVDSVRQSEVHFPEIDKLMAERYKTLPYAQAEKVAQAIYALKQGTITRGQLPILEAYYKETREAYYAQKNGVSTSPVKKSATKPPAVESAGSGAEVPETFDFSKMRAMNRKEKDAYLENFFKKRAQ